jgi:hypothetical protein
MKSQQNNSGKLYSSIVFEMENGSDQKWSKQIGIDLPFT